MYSHLCSHTADAAAAAVNAAAAIGLLSTGFCGSRSCPDSTQAAQVVCKWETLAVAVRANLHSFVCEPSCHPLLQYCRPLRQQRMR
jgi:hypothetical protein